jgi:hypothetical protein
MISYRITSKSISQTPVSTSGDVNKDKIFNRAISKAIKVFSPGDKVMFIGLKRKAEVLEILLDINRVSWKGEKPFFIKIKFEDNDQVVLSHSSSLKRVKK